MLKGKHPMKPISDRLHFIFILPSTIEEHNFLKQELMKLSPGTKELTFAGRKGVYSIIALRRDPMLIGTHCFLMQNDDSPPIQENNNKFRVKVIRTSEMELADVIPHLIDMLWDSTHYIFRGIKREEVIRDYSIQYNIGVLLIPSNMSLFKIIAEILRGECIECEEFTKDGVTFLAGNIMFKKEERLAGRFYLLPPGSNPDNFRFVLHTNDLYLDTATDLVELVSESMKKLCILEEEQHRMIQERRESYNEDRVH